MQVCTSLKTDNHASTSPLSFLQAGYPSCRPTSILTHTKQMFINGTDLKLQLNTSTNVVPSKSDGGNQLN